VRLLARRAGIVATLAIAGAALGSPAAADWLVRRDGKPLETAGPWQVVAGQVHFRTPAGEALSLQVAEVDLAASARLTRDRAAGRRPATGLAAAAAATRADRLTRPPAVAVIDDRDLEPADAAAAEATPAAEAPVILYSTSWCPWCRKSKELLASLRVPFEERDIERDPAARAAMERLVGAGAGVPVLARGARAVRGHDPARIRALVSDLIVPVAGSDE
jgi:glutaredoxin